jgi:nucleoid-associated protein EbfC
MFGDMMSKLQDMKKSMEEAKARLENISVKVEDRNKEISIIINGNKKIKDLKINERLTKTENKEELEDILLITINQAIEKAETIYESEMKGMAKGLLPGMPGF